MELSGLKSSIDRDSQCSSRGWGQQLLLLAVFMNITCGPPAAADHNSSYCKLCKGTNHTANVKRESDNQVTTKSIVYQQHSPMEIGKACRVGPMDKPGRGTMRSGWHSQWVQPNALSIAIQPFRTCIRWNRRCNIVLSVRNGMLIIV